MKLRLGGKKNVFQEIAEQYKQYIRLGVISAGEKLPSCRELAMELGINPNTVERAYSLLEQEGLVVTLPKKGTFVASESDVLTEAERQIAALKAAGMTEAELIGLVGKIYKEN